MTVTLLSEDQIRKKEIDAKKARNGSALTAAGGASSGGISLSTDIPGERDIRLTYNKLRYTIYGRDETSYLFEGDTRFERSPTG